MVAGSRLPRRVANPLRSAGNAGKRALMFAEATGGYLPPGMTIV
jgi:hypothetical protein